MLNALVVDGSNYYCGQLTDLLVAAGFEVESAQTGSEGLEKAQQTRYRLVCCSDNLKDFASSEFCSQLRSLNGYEFVTLLVLTEHDNAKSLKQALLAGATDIFSKHDITEMET